ncbi:MAG TPA: hypothetical protein VMT89_01885 [Candidatus Acidoferrales bacterium]|nr:hypothetical protein [Candidatus Acidoferrales bacterium]
MSLHEIHDHVVTDDDWQDLGTPQQREWARCRHWIEEALRASPGVETIEDVEDRLTNLKYIFIPGENCAAICEVVQFTARKIFFITHGGGDLEELLTKMEPVCVKLAKLFDCDGVIGLGRLGWKKPCEKIGYKLAYIAMIKDLE